MSKRALGGYLIVLLVALFWRFTGITFDSLWLDEGYQTVVGAYGQPLPNFLCVPDQPFVYKPGPPAETAEMLANFRKVDPLTPPLYQLLLNRWIAAFGGDDLSLRSMSVLFSVLAGAGVYVVSYLLFGWRAALFAGLIQAFSSFDVLYAQEVRMYSLEEFAAVCSCGSLLIYLLRPLSAPARFGVLAVHAVATWAMINSHYTGLFIFLFSLAMGTVVTLARRDLKAFIQLTISWAMVAVLWLPWLPMFLQAASLRTAAFYVSREPTWWWPVRALLFNIPGNWVLYLTGKQVVGWALPLYVVAVLMLVLVALLFMPPKVVSRQLVHDTVNRSFKLRLTLVLMWAVIPAVALWLMDVKENHRVIEISRYMIGTAPAIYILCGAGLGALQNKSKLALGLLVSYALFAAINNAAHVTLLHQREPWRQMAALVESTVGKDEIVLVSQYYDLVCLDRYLNNPYRQVGVSGITTRAQLEDILSGAPRFYLITAQEGDRIRPQIPHRYRILDHQDLGHSLHFIIYDCQQPLPMVK